MSKEIQYLTAMHMAKQLLKKGIIDERHYREFDTKMVEKYHPILGDLFTDLSLINCEGYGNM